MNIGDKVVCIDDSPCRNCNCVWNNTKDKIYVVSAIKTRKHGNGVVGLGIMAIGVSFRCNCRNDDGYAPSFYFRTLEELKQKNTNQKVCLNF